MVMHMRSQDRPSCAGCRARSGPILVCAAPGTAGALSHHPTRVGGPCPCHVAGGFCGAAGSQHRLPPRALPRSRSIHHSNPLSSRGAMPHPPPTPPFLCHTSTILPVPPLALGSRGGQGWQWAPPCLPWAPVHLLGSLTLPRSVSALTSCPILAAAGIGVQQVSSWGCCPRPLLRSRGSKGPPAQPLHGAAASLGARGRPGGQVWAEASPALGPAGMGCRCLACRGGLACCARSCCRQDGRCCPALVPLGLIFLCHSSAAGAAVHGGGIPGRVGTAFPRSVPYGRGAAYGMLRQVLAAVLCWHESSGMRHRLAPTSPAGGLALQSWSPGAGPDPASAPGVPQPQHGFGTAVGTAARPPRAAAPAYSAGNAQLLAGPSSAPPATAALRQVQRPRKPFAAETAFRWAAGNRWHMVRTVPSEQCPGPSIHTEWRQGCGGTGPAPCHEGRCPHQQHPLLHGPVLTPASRQGWRALSLSRGLGTLGFGGCWGPARPAAGGAARCRSATASAIVGSAPWLCR